MSEEVQATTIDPNGPYSPEARLIAEQINGLCREFKRYNDRRRTLVFAVIGLSVLAVLTVGSTLWGLIFNMEDDMNEMNRSMVQMKGDMREMNLSMGDMKGDMHQMRTGIDSMSEVMITMRTMGEDVRTMSGSVATMSRDVTIMSQNVGVMSTMTPAVQRMSTDTNSMQRDMHWMMPFNWMP